MFVDVSKAVQYTHTDLFVSTGKQYSAEATGMFYLATGIIETDGLIGENRVSFNSDKRLAIVVSSLPPTLKQNERTPLQSFYYFPVKKGEPLYLGPNRSSRSISYYIIPFS